MDKVAILENDKRQILFICLNKPALELGEVEIRRTREGGIAYANGVAAFAVMGDVVWDALERAVSFHACGTLAGKLTRPVPIAVHIDRNR